MDIIQIIGLGMAAGALLLVIRQQRPELALLLSVAIGVIIFVLMMGRIMMVIDGLRSLGRQAQIDGTYMATILKILGIAYLTDFGAQVLTDAGEKAVAAKIEMAGKVLILLLAIPVVLAILDSVLNMVARGG